MTVSKFRRHTMTDPIDINHLYRASPGDPLAKMIGLLDLAIIQVEKLSTAVDGCEPLQINEESMQLVALLRKLFCFRHVGEGFGNLIGALETALGNTSGQLLTQQQVFIIGNVLKHLRSAPFLTFEASLADIEQLQNAGLNIAPSEILDLADAISKNSAG
jgi:hypothetical protein